MILNSSFTLWDFNSICLGQYPNTCIHLKSIYIFSHQVLISAIYKGVPNVQSRSDKRVFQNEAIIKTFSFIPNRLKGWSTATNLMGMGNTRQNLMKKGSNMNI